MSTEIWDDNKISDKTLNLGNLWFKRCDPKDMLVIKTLKGPRGIKLTGRYDPDVFAFAKILERSTFGYNIKALRQRLMNYDTYNKFMIFKQYDVVLSVIVKNTYLDLIKFKLLEKIPGNDKDIYTIELLGKKYGAAKIVNNSPLVSLTYKEYTLLLFNCFTKKRTKILGVV